MTSMTTTQAIEKMQQAIFDLDPGINEILYNQMGRCTSLALAVYDNGSEVLGSSSAVSPSAFSDNGGALLALNDLFTKITALNEGKKELSDSAVFVVTNSKGHRLLEFRENGDIYVNGVLAENNEQVVEGFKQFLIEKNILSGGEN